MLKPKYIALWMTLAILAPAVAQAYVSPYEVLLTPDLIWPPSPRDSEAKVEWQHQQRDLSRFPRPRSASSSSHASTSSAASSATTSEDTAEEAALDPELKSLLRALERLQDNQERASLRAEALNMLREEGLLVVPEEGVHGTADLLSQGKGLSAKGKGPLTPSGAGSMLAIMTGLTAIGWTIRRTASSRAILR